jgi:hypothetical protein
MSLHRDTDNADQWQLTDFSKQQNKSMIMIMSGVTYLYNNKDILDEICQAIRDYETEKERIETVCEDNYDNITNDGIAILENAARQAYLDGKLVV